MLRALSVCVAEVAAGEQMFMHPHGSVVLATPPKQVSQREVQFTGFRIVLHGFDEGINRLVLLLIEEEVQAAEIGFRCLLLGSSPLANINPGRHPAQCENQREHP